MMPRWSQKSFVNAFKKYVAPFIVHVGQRRDEIVKTISERLYAISHGEEAERINCVLVLEARCLVVENRGGSIKVDTDYCRAND